MKTLQQIEDEARKKIEFCFGPFDEIDAAFVGATITGAINQAVARSSKRRDFILGKMIDADGALYERILDTPVFAYWFNELARIAGA